MTKRIIFSNNSNRVPKNNLHVSYLSIDVMNSCMIMESCRDLEWIDVDISVTYVDSDLLDRSEEDFLEFLEDVRSTDFLIVFCHSTPDHFHKFNRLLSFIQMNEVKFFINTNSSDYNTSMREASGLSQGQYEELKKYVVLGGEKNNVGLLLWLCKNIKGYHVAVPEPLPPLSQGIYHPKDKLVKNEEKFISSLSPDWPTVAVLFQQRSWLEDNTAPIDALIASFERSGAQTIPIFFTSNIDDSTGSIGVSGIIKKYLTKNRRPIVDAVVIVSGFSQNAFTGTRSFSEENIFASLGVPVFQASTVPFEGERWLKGDCDLTQQSVTYSLFQTEYDGQIYTAPLNFTETGKNERYLFGYVQDRVDKIAGTVMGWVKLRRTERSKARIAFVLNSGGELGGRMGAARGLDTFISLRKILTRMSSDGYTLDHSPESSKTIIAKLTSAVGQPSPGDERRIGVPEELFKRWFEDMPDECRYEMSTHWGNPPGDAVGPDGKIPIPGIINGNVFIGVEPELDPDSGLVPSYRYLAFYRWISEVFHADAIVHVGSQGWLERLEGRDVLLTKECWPEVILGNMPMIYPFNISSTGEGLLAKRRINAVLIGYADPPIVRAGLYGGLERFEFLYQQEMHARMTNQSAKLLEIERQLCDVVRETNLLSDIGYEGEADDSTILSQKDNIFHYVRYIKNTPIQEGYHVFGAAPRGSRLTSIITRVLNDSAAGNMDVVGALAESKGLDIEVLRGTAGGSGHGMVDMDALEALEGEAFELISKFNENGFVKDSCIGLCGGDQRLRDIAAEVCDMVYPTILSIRDEMDCLMKAMRGDFVLPGPSGVLSYRTLHILPAGRNFCSTDPLTVPNEISYHVGTKVADRLVEEYRNSHGKNPEQVSIFLNLTENMTTGGDQMSCILALMGVRPRWNSLGGSIDGIDAISLEELGRPRIDVVITANDLIYSVFPESMELIRDAVEMVLGLDEPPEMNYLIKHYVRDVRNFSERDITEEEARMYASMRVFNDNPRMLKFNASDGTRKKMKNARMGDVTGMDADNVQKSVTKLYAVRMRDTAMTANTYVDILGKGVDRPSHPIGIAEGGCEEMVISEDQVASLSSELARAVRTTVLNPVWIRGQMSHGYTGAGEMSRIICGLFGWATETDAVKNWMLEGITQRYVFDETISEWMMDCNPEARRDIIEYLYGTIESGSWSTTPETIFGLKEAFLETEERLEECSDEMSGGGNGR